MYNDAYSLRCMIEHPNFADKDFTRVTIFKDKFEVTVGTLVALSVMVVFNVMPSGRCLFLTFQIGISCMLVRENEAI